jgi:hypothetical protein
MGMRGQGMGEISRRIDRIEQILGDADCICNTKRSSLVAVRPGGIGEPGYCDAWTKEQRELAEASMGFTCPTHGFQRQRVLWISEVEVNL